MPHDINGKKLEVGDRVVIEFEVKQVYPQADKCNLVLGTVVEGDYRELTMTAACVEKKETDQMSDDKKTPQPAPQKPAEAPQKSSSGIPGYETKHKTTPPTQQ